MGGTSSGDAAARYLSEVLRDAGLAVESREDPPVWTHAEEHWRVELCHAGEEPVPLESAWPLGFSPPARGEAPLADGAAAGVALLAERTPPWLRRRTAPAGGTPAVVLVTGRATAAGEHAALAELPRGAACPVFVLGPADSASARALLERGGGSLRFELHAEVARRQPRTVIAELSGREPGGFFLVCAHGDADSGGPGANDNASGVAIVLEMACAWAAAVERGAIRPPARAVRFAIWGREIHSSRAFLQRLRAREEQLLGVLNFDQAGFGQAGDRLHIEPDDLPANVAFVRTALGVLADARELEGFPRRWVTNARQGGTDSYVFSDAADGVDPPPPAVTFYASAWDRARELPRTAGMPGESWNDGERVRVDFDPWYHTTGDLPENTTDRQPWHLGWNARVGLLSVQRFLDGLESATERDAND